MWKKDSRWEFYEFRAKNCQHKEKMDAFLVKQICSLPHAHTVGVVNMGHLVQYRFQSFVSSLETETSVFWV